MNDSRDEMIKLIRETHAMVCALDRKLASGAAQSAAPAMGAAPDHELDSDYANFVVDKMPKRWTGDDFSGSRLSETNAEFCRAVAGLKRWKGDKEKSEGKTYPDKKTGEIKQSWDFSYKQAAWALGWAARFDAGYQAPARKADPLEGFPGADADIPY